METYNLLRQFADSWMLLALFLFFVGMVIWVYRPSRRASHDDAAQMIFRNERAPARDPKAPPNREVPPNREEYPKNEDRK